MKMRLPCATIAIVLGALVLAGAPALHPFLNYDRDRIFAGELWRMFTGHWLHLSRSHLVYDVAAFAVIGSIAESRNPIRFRAMCFVAPWLISATLLILAPNMQEYYGLSALAVGAWTYSAALTVRASRWLALAMFAAAAAKIVFELQSGRSVFFHPVTSNVHIAVISHITGAIIGTLFAVIPSCVSAPPRAKQGRSESPDYSRQV